MKFTKILLGLVTLFSIASIGNAQTSNFYFENEPWLISEFNSKLEIQKDSSIIVTENILADFSKATYKHGIYRDIPIQYRDGFGQNLDIRFTLIGITDENGQSYEYQKTNEGSNVHLKIGSADIYIDGQIKTYNIKYKLERGLNQFKDHDELFWNTTGNNWPVPIIKSKTIISLPSASPNLNEMTSTCYTGYGYSKDQLCSSKALDNQTFEFISNAPLLANQGITVVAGFPKNLINYPNTTTYLFWFLQDNWGYFLPLLVLAFMFYKWHTIGRDPTATRSSIMPEYEAPDNLRPAEIGTLIDDRADMVDITSSIIDLATRGYLQIIEKKDKKLIWESTSYSLKKLDTPKNALPLKPFEEKILNKLFESGESVEMDDLKYKFYTEIPKINEAIYSSLVSQKYYHHNPEKIRNDYMGWGIGIFSLAIFALPFIIEFSPSLGIGLVASAVIVFCFSFIMPRKTQKGIDTKMRILGLEEFIKTAEVDRLKFYEKENIFEKILPYAIALGLADKWAKACEGLNKGTPEWYSSSDPGFNFIRFNNSLNSFNQNLGSNLATSPRSSASGGSSGFGGGGFSGGGFGGGGGGSW